MFEAVADIAARCHFEAVVVKGVDVRSQVRSRRTQPIAQVVAILKECDDEIDIVSIEAERLIGPKVSDTFVPSHDAVPLDFPLLISREDYVWIKSTPAEPFWHL